MVLPPPKAPDLSAQSAEARWRAEVARAHQGRSPEGLASSTPEGLQIAPLYPRAAATARALRQKPGAWRIFQRVDNPEPEAANSMAQADLQTGADALILAVAGAPAARGFGLTLNNESDLDRALAGIDLDLTPLRIDAGPRTLELAPLFSVLARRRRLASAALDVDFGHDPIGDLARSGASARPMSEIGQNAAEMSRRLRDTGFAGRLMLADGRPYHEAGAGEAQELAATLAAAVAYLRLLEGQGLSLAEARGEIAFLLAADADEFLTVAKFRALRRLWAQVERACGLTPEPARLHAESSFRMMTKYDPWTNILRAGMAAFSAGVGGADAIALLPFTLALGLPDDFARRIARNTQLLLIHEAHLAKVTDPAAGAGAFEALTDELCGRAWALFQQLENEGGIFRSLKTGALQREIAATAAARRRALARRTQGIIGTSSFAMLAETPAPVVTPGPSIEPVSPRAGAFAPLLAQRDAEPFENLRDSAQAQRARSGSFPQVFLAKLGSVEGSAPWARFARDFFAAGGLQAVNDIGFANPQDVEAAFRESASKIACICASDSESVERIVATARRLVEAGARLVFLAARADAKEAARRAGDVDDFIFPGCEALAILDRALAGASDKN
ncbi:methylmalonyl-CoA mutase family protein [Methylocapsa acidiphila]|uniref:methylmalonyl-CoA mutase family protein n=1 Tax=Methylocapsa acidiphila TaxID=133552 RepID=UPI00040A8574|nr:methylmalonyl-CoA mutase family protein [Methylocapsa acidiphila]